MNVSQVRSALVIAALSIGSAAIAAPPTHVMGNWIIHTGDDYTTLDITNQGASGAPGASQCRVILGSLGIAPVRGFYCPGSGRIHFLHNNLSTNVTVRTFTGSVTEDANGVMHMAGSLNVLAHAFGDLGEYPFSATK